MDINDFVDILDSDFYTGVPDSQLKPLCNYLYDHYGVNSKHHIVAANEGNCVGLAAGYNLATGKIPVVYMQNSGEGNAVNPIASLLNPEVYGIPCKFVVGWRGEPGIHDEPQHIFQGKITVQLLDDLGIVSFVLSKDTTVKQLSSWMDSVKNLLEDGKSIAIVVRKGALVNNKKVEYNNPYTLLREDAIRIIVDYTGSDPIVSTTGKASRELFEIREARGETHEHDFLTVGSMGHCSSIALSISLNKPDLKIWCIDGDGAILMHMGSMGVIGNMHPQNFIHVVLNNEAHETVGGMPTVSHNMNLKQVAEGCGYDAVYVVSNEQQLREALKEAKSKDYLTLIEIKCALGSRSDLGRPTTTPFENKERFMRSLS